ncbi:hypothetical protein AADZ90_022135 [Aestuariibius sp. 2305UL40-4]|uniref:hypothetical protein n=1 Tax=Aestuariibius violaceus TaxID=3234132 RepID=UPI00398F4850
MSIDWPSASEETRARVFEVTRELVALLKTDWQSFLREAYDSPNYVVEPHEVSNFERGLLARRKVAMVHRLIVERHLDMGIRFAPDLFDPSLKTTWRKVLDDHGRYGKLRSIRAPSGLGLNRRNRYPTEGTPLVFGEQFYFEVALEVGGTVLLLEEYAFRWYPLPLTELLEPHTALRSAGTHSFPWDSLQKWPILLDEQEHAGRHGYAMIVGPKSAITPYADRMAEGVAVRAEVLDGLAERLAEEDPAQVEIHRLNLMFDVWPREREA